MAFQNPELQATSVSEYFYIWEFYADLWTHILGKNELFHAILGSNHAFSSGRPHISTTATESPLTEARGNSGVNLRCDDK